MNATTPTLFAHKYDDRQGSLDHCAVCGRKVNPATCYWVETVYGSEPIREDDPRSGGNESSGSFPVGSECAKQFPAGYLARA